MRRSHLETELVKLKNAIVEMAGLAENQMEKAKIAFMQMDTETAREVIHNEKRMNALELTIDRDCEDIFALLNPVASDLRFVIAALKINSDLERIGDYADGIADYVVDFAGPCKDEIIESTRLEEMFDISISMVGDIKLAIQEEDSTLARKVYKKDAELNEINENASFLISEFVKKNPETSRETLFLFSTIRKLERVGDHVKNIAEDLVFFLEAEVMKHTRQKENE